MKQLLSIFAVLIGFGTLQAQVIDHKGNRNQTYPLVTETNPAVVDMINQVDTVNLFNTISWMQQFIRDAEQPEALIVQNYLLDRFEELGLETYIYNHTATIGGTDTLEAGSVIAIQPGTEFPDEYIIVSSHYDHPDGPGADDNASGTSGVLECARILSQYSFKRTILYIPFNAEELMMVGSYPFARKCASEDMNILGVFNMDMIGFWPGEEYGDITMYSGYSYISERLFDYYQHVANLYIPDMHTYRFSTIDSEGGDQMSFNIFEYPALYIGDIEYDVENIYFHTPSDTIGAGVNCFALAGGFVKAVVAATAELANGWLAPQDFSAIVKNGDAFLSWKEAPETESYKLFKDNELLAETTDTSYIDEAFVDGEWHRYYVKGVKANGVESPASNMDSLLMREPLQIPVFYDFEDDNTDGLILNNDNWSIANYQQHNSLIAKTYTCNNILQTVEFQWFSIPETVEDVALSLKIIRKFTAFWNTPTNDGPWVPVNINVFVEVTTDRKTWHKLAQITPEQTNHWKEYIISLNDYIGCDYLQARIRYEGNGYGKTISSYYLIAIDNLCITFDPSGVTEKPINERFNLSVSPNPTEGLVNISSELKHAYSVSVYDITGVKVLSNDSFSDGTLDLGLLPKGMYFITADNGNDRITKRIVLK